MQTYMKQKSMEDARLEFRWRTKMVDNRANMSGKYKDKICPHCSDGVVESNAHWLNCSAYSELRREAWQEGRDPEYVSMDRLRYLKVMMLMRAGLEKDLLQAKK